MSVAWKAVRFLRGRLCSAVGSGSATGLGSKSQRLCQTCHILALVLTTTIMSGMLAATSARAQDFYRGKRITIVVGLSAGGGYDLNARLLARHLGRHIPGRPDIIVANMPGAGSQTAVNYVNNSVPKDGTYIVHFNFGLITEARLKPERNLDFTRFGWIGSISQDLAVCLLWGGLGIKTLDEARARKVLHFGLTAAGSSSDINARIVKGVFGLPIHQVGGYPGSAEQRIAVERGELDGQCGPWSSTPVEWIRDKKIYAMMRFTPVTAPDLPADVPYAVDIAPTPRGAEIIKLLTAGAQLGRPFVVSQEVPKERLDILRKAFEATMADPLFKEDAAKGRMDVTPRTGDESLAIIKALNNTSADVVRAATEILEEK
jgi:tripartite-type tricarboxylate transporter receptor subunit TctC